MNRGEVVRHVIGLGAMLLIVVGLWGLWGWQWAAIAAGAPVAAFYVWGEVRAAAAARPERAE